MPELPEITIIVKDLQKHITNSKIINIDFEDNYLSATPNEVLMRELKNKNINKIERIGKNIVMHIDKKFLTIHLAMTGRLLLKQINTKPSPYCKIIFTLEKNNKPFELRFCDVRKFGKVKLIDEEKSFEQFKGKYGPETFDLKPKEFLEIIKSKRTNIKNLLLDQSKISGLGNIYVNDALHMAKIHPKTLTNSFNLEMADRLLKTCNKILLEGIRNRGISMSDFVDIFEQPGNQQKYFKIYKKSECNSCKGKVTFEKINGRGTYFCENCQK